MNKRWLSYLLLMMIALQSLFAVASQQQPHQIDADHLKVEHSHQSDKLLTVADQEFASPSGHSVEDCHHCGHCHGSHSVNWVASIFSFSLDQRDHNKLSSFQPAYLRSFADNLLRPPIFS